MSLEYQQEITLDLNTRSAPPVIYGAKQGDANTRTIKINVTKDGVRYQFTGDEMTVLRAHRPDGSDVSGYAQLGIAEGCLYVTLSEDILAVAGRVLTDIVITDGSNEYLSTVSFIIDVQRAPIDIMNYTPGSGEMLVFSDLLTAVESIPSLIVDANALMETAITSAAIAVESAAIAASAASEIIINGIVITPASMFAPGSLPGNIFEKVDETTNNFYYHSPVTKIKTTASIATGTALGVEVTYPTLTPSPGEQSNLLLGMDFAFTMPQTAALSTTFGIEAQGMGADAYAVGQFVTNAQVPASHIETANNTAIFNNDVLKPEYGGTGVSTTAAGLLNAIGAQRYINTANIILSSDGWTEGEDSVSKVVEIQGINLNSEWFAGPSGKESWDKAGEFGLFAEGVTAEGSMTFSCDNAPDASILVTVYYW